MHALPRDSYDSYDDTLEFSDDFIYILLYCNVMIQVLKYGISYRKNWYLFFFRNVHIEGQYIGLFVDSFSFLCKNYEFPLLFNSS